MPLSRAKIWAANAVFIAFVGAIVYSGFSWPLGYGQGLWPFKSTWGMFSNDDNTDYFLRASGKYKDGHEGDLDIHPLFAFGAAVSGNRFQEMHRTQKLMDRLAHYLCTKFDLVSVTIEDVSWPRTPGPRANPENHEPAKVNVWSWLKDFPCDS